MNYDCLYVYDFYIIEHKRNIVDNIENPKYNNDSKILNLTNNSIRQLNVVNNYSYFKGKNESLLSIINICTTSMVNDYLKIDYYIHQQIKVFHREI